MLMFVMNLFWRQEVVCGMAIHFQDGGSRSYWTLTALGLIQLKRLLKRKERKKEVCGVTLEKARCAICATVNLAI